MDQLSDIYVKVNHVYKGYGNVSALENISFDTQKGELFGFIGPDGAGKTTLFRILTTLLIPDKGSAKIDSLDVVDDYKHLRQMIGYMPGRFSLYQDLSVEENLNFFAAVFGSSIQDNYEMIKDIYSQIEPFKKRKAGNLSGGMKQKLALSCALIHKPDILVLDEPTTGVDAVSRHEFWNMLKKLKSQGITIIVSTPYMDEASLCDRVALIQKGNIMKINTPDNIIREFGQELYAVRTNNIHRLIKELKSMKETYTAFPYGQYVHLTLHKNGTIENIRDQLEKRGFINPEIRHITPNIEDCFMDLMIKQ